jgi:hypothetical protein
VTERVVDFLESVEVDEHDRQRLQHGARRNDQRFKMRIGKAAVRQTGQHIDIGQMLDARAA